MIDLALYVPGHRTLVLADIHLGFEEALHREGTLVPRGYLPQLLVRLKHILDQLSISKHNLERLIINGDLCHQFGPLTPQEHKKVRGLIRHLGKISREVVVLQGNHDGNLNLLLEHENVKLFLQYDLDDLLFIHGDREPDQIPPGIRTIIIGHEHPAVGLRDPVTGRVELFKCFLVGPYRRRRLILQPSFNPWVQGSDLMRERCLSPLLDEEALGAFEVYPVSDGGEVLRLGPLKQIMEMTKWSALSFAD